MLIFVFSNLKNDGLRMFEKVGHYFHHEPVFYHLETGSFIAILMMIFVLIGSKIGKMCVNFQEIRLRSLSRNRSTFHLETGSFVVIFMMIFVFCNLQNGSFRVNF